VSHVVANGVTFHVQRLGDAGPPAVMLHGLLLGSVASWYFTAAPALARDHRVLLYDLRGHGKSERVPSGYDVATMSRDLACLTADDVAEPLDLIGHSFGALVALRFALDNPGRVRRLVLVEAPLPPSRFGQFAAFLEQSPGEMVESLPGPLREAMAGGSRRARRLLQSLSFLVGETSLVRDLEAEADIPDRELATVRCPTLCVYGNDSECRPVGDRLVAAMPNAELLALAGGHYLHLDQAEALTARIAEFCHG